MRRVHAAFPSRPAHRTIAALTPTATPTAISTASVRDALHRDVRTRWERARMLGARVIPVWRELVCDADTPLSAYAKLRVLPGPRFLLESVVGGERWARYSFVGVGRRERLVAEYEDTDPSVAVAASCRPSARIDPPPSDPGGIAERHPTIDAAIGALQTRYRAAHEPALPRFWGGLVGVWGHDFARQSAPIPRIAPPMRERLPVVDCLVTDVVIVFDALAQHLRVVTMVCPERDGGLDEGVDAADVRIARVVEALTGTPRLRAMPVPRVDDALLARARARLSHPCGMGSSRADAGDALAHGQPVPARWDFPSRVQQAKRAIVDGEVFQLVLSQRFEQAPDGLSPLDVYRQLRLTNPSPYMLLLELESGALAGASPEVLVRVEEPERRVIVRPIAGTRPRGRDDVEDRAREAELCADVKERAEHLMLVDLGRNDLGRVACGGSVHVRESFVIERYSRVMHLVSEVCATLAPDMSALAALKATFPAGTLSGAPKVRALQLIDALEPVDRDWYGGAVGYFGFDGAADFAICIRAVVFAGDTLRVQAGAGVVFDSDPEAEDAECKAKALAVAVAIELARDELQRQETPP